MVWAPLAPLTMFQRLLCLSYCTYTSDGGIWGMVRFLDLPKELADSKIPAKKIWEGGGKIYLESDTKTFALRKILIIYVCLN